MGKRNTRKPGQGSLLRKRAKYNEAHIRRTTARIVSTNAHRDREKSESVNALTPGQVLHELVNKLINYLITELREHSDMFEKGEIIADSRGAGSQQKMEVS